MKDKILIVDVETTHVSFKKGSLIEIGATELNIKTGKRKVVFNSLCREDRLTAKHREEPYGWIFSNSDLTVEMVRKAPKFEDVAKKFQKVVDKYKNGATAFNRAFDMGYLKDRGIVFLKLQPCLMLTATDVCKLPGKRGGYKWPKVTEYIKMFLDPTYEEDHRGAQDSFDEAGICWDLIKKGVYKIE